MHKRTAANKKKLRTGHLRICVSVCELKKSQPLTACESISTCGDNHLFLFIMQRSPRFENNTFLLVFLSISSQYIDKNMIPLAPPSQEGMGEASLAPPRDVIALGVGRRLVDARAWGRLRRARAPRGGGRRLAP